MNKKNACWSLGIVMGIVLAGGGLAWGDEPEPESPATPAAPATENSEEEDCFESYQVLIDTIEEIDRNYVVPFSRRELIDAAIEGVFKKLDPYSDYIPREQMDGFRKDIDSRFGGVGVQIAQEGNHVVILAPLFGTPAYRAGVYAGDVVLEVDGKSTDNLNLNEVSELMRGEIGTRMVLRVSRQGVPEPLTLEMEREIISMETVCGFQRNADDSWNYWLDEQNGIAYILISSFSQDTTNEFKNALETIQKPKTEGAASPLRGLILDVRYNPGGLLPVVVEICDLFVREGTIVSVQGRNVEKRVWEAKSEGTIPDEVKMVVLLNNYSASASEILAACLQDHGRAVLVGERSWGKGSVQSVMELEDGNSALKLTTAGYFRPNGRNIHRAEGATESDEWGVSPEDAQLVSLTPKQNARLLEDLRQRQELRTHQGTSAPQTARESFEDPQLRKAMDVMGRALNLPAPTEGSQPPTRPRFRR